MPARPPSPTFAPASPTITSPNVPTHDERTLATTAQVVDALENAAGITISEVMLESLLLEFERRGYLECVSYSNTGTAVWDLTDVADRLADVIAAVVVDAVTTWVSDSAHRKC
ncbi:hypothetical protein [Natrarchaeobaculum sulfurireducens]|uniref:Uncharacterized protein n=1 Tax=Natrarchaeobaculum sulfurireducens TaxID=2044521 RepID=A0A346PG01_9EURY|nr:hypothetical protein [Natrarchaeobaculum sulfurireducens]AXR78446.1 hypothetical protein AArc1_2128 [Natrarchaeobaculum sulfurireducens]